MGTPKSTTKRQKTQSDVVSQTWETMPFDDFVDWAFGLLLISIAKGEARSTFWQMLNLAHQRGYAKGEEASR